MCVCLEPAVAAAMRMAASFPGSAQPSNIVSVNDGVAVAARQSASYVWAWLSIQMVRLEPTMTARGTPNVLPQFLYG